jgi:GTP cyclohydrolase I
VAYLPGQCIIGLSKLARAVEHCARAIHEPEGLAHRIADWIDEHLAAAGSGVIIESQPEFGDSLGERGRQTTTALRGRLRDDPAVRAEFLTLSGYPTGR